MIPLKDNNIVEILIRNDPKEAWADYSNLLIYTEQDQDTVLKPYLDFVNSLPGFVSLTIDRESNDANIMYKEILFDTCEHAISAARRLYGVGREPIVKARDDLVVSKQDNPAAFERRVFACKEPFSKTVALGKVLPGIG